MNVIFRSWCVACLVAGLAACGGSSATAPVRQEYNPSLPAATASRSPAAASRMVHVVSKGETLYSIAFHHGMDFRDLAWWNRIKSPYVITIGQRLALKGSTRKAAPAVVAKAPAKPARQPQKTVVTVQSRPLSGWQWPTSGKIRTGYKASGNKGIDIAGQPGQAIYAAENGKVVYSGGGLKGYGQLIIIKHNETFLSAYAHNRRLLVSQGDVVKRRQQIAEMGRRGNKGVLLHFEIRRDGKPVDPLRYLPRRTD